MNHQIVITMRPLLIVAFDATASIIAIWLKKAPTYCIRVNSRVMVRVRVRAMVRVRVRVRLAKQDASILPVRLRVTVTVMVTVTVQ